MQRAIASYLCGLLVTVAPPTSRADDLEADAAALTDLVAGRATPNASADLFEVDLLSPVAVRKRLDTLAQSADADQGALEELRRRLENVEADLPPPPAPPDAPPAVADEAPPMPPIEDFLGGSGPHPPTKRAQAEEARKAHHAQATDAWKRRLAERAQAAARLATARRIHEGKLAERRAQVAQAGAALAGEAQALRTRLRVNGLRRTYLTSVRDFLNGASPTALSALRSLRRGGELERARATEFLEGGEAHQALDTLALRLEALADRAAAGSLVGFTVDMERLERDARRAVATIETVRGASTALAERIRTLGQRMDDEWARLGASTLLGLRAPDLHARIDTLYSQRYEAERRARRALKGPPTADRAQSAMTAMQRALKDDVPNLTSMSNAREALDGAEGALGRFQAALEVADADLAWRELAFDRQVLAALAPFASDSVRDPLQGAGLSRRWLLDGRLEVLDARAGLLAWSRARWSTLQDPSSRRRVAGALAWSLAALLGFGLSLGLRGPLRAGVRATVGALVSTLSGPRTSAAVRCGVLAEALVGPAWTLIAGLVAFEFLGDRLPEWVAARSLFVGCALYLLVRETLVGLTTPGGPGRPPLWPAPPATRDLLAKTWRRIGVPLVVTGVVDELARNWLHGGVLSAGVRWALWLFVGAWALWSLVAWRGRLATWWTGAASPEGFEARAARWYSESTLGGVLSPLVVARFLIQITLRSLRGLLSMLGALVWFQSLRLRRQARRLDAAGHEVGERGPPQTYRDRFGPDFPVLEDGNLPESRRAVARDLLEIVDRWQRDPGPGAAVLIAESGMGKSAVLAEVSRNLHGDVQRCDVPLGEKVLTPDALAKVLAGPLGLPDAPDLDAIAEILAGGGPRIVVVDDVHHLFLRTVGGYDAFDALVRLVVRSGDNTFWLLAVGQYAWDFLSRRHRAEHHFDDVVPVPPLTPEELETLITRRHATTGCQLRFDEVIHSADAGAPGAGLRLVESIEGFFRLLTEASGGNPHIAQRLWLEALTPTDDGDLQVGVFPSVSVDRLKDGGEAALFALAAFILHETLTTEELATVTNVTQGEAEAVVERLRGRGILTQEFGEARGRLTVAAPCYRTVLRFLHRKHLL